MGSKWREGLPQLSWQLYSAVVMSSCRLRTRPRLRGQSGSKTKADVVCRTRAEMRRPFLANMMKGRRLWDRPAVWRMRLYIGTGSLQGSRPAALSLYAWVLRIGQAAGSPAAGSVDQSLASAIGRRLYPTCPIRAWKQQGRVA
ncbi:hypothetical protein MPH_06782 [Macrophomina phaseolina MS6]|uniref:Uncharacterized protein n=1 Tax=Macrophomina phaseolina (strain MS6) TaxID=1126212 RepID=K2RTS2_MACPH|nr:hypothetical protein MPH_06782 [Macrophomina phaseolina MS6]